MSLGVSVQSSEVLLIFDPRNTQHLRKITEKRLNQNYIIYFSIKDLDR